MSSLMNKSIIELNGVGSRRGKLFSKLGAPTIGDLLRLYPNKYEDWSKPIKVSEIDVLNDSPCVIKGFISSPISENKIKKNMTIYKTKVCDGISFINLIFFNNKYIIKQLKQDEEYLFRGNVKHNNYSKEMISPIFYKVGTKLSIRPIYPQTSGLTTKQIENAMKNALSLLPEKIKDPISKEIRKKYNLCDLKFAIKNIHFPDNFESLKLAKDRLVFEELLILQLGLLYFKSNKITKNNILKIEEDYIKEFFDILPFKLTNAQVNTIKECIYDMKNKNKPMSRLIQGDVGSGKTAVCAALCHTIVMNKMQCAFMVPTEILAKQHYKWFSETFKSLNFKVELLTGSNTLKEKRIIYESLKNGTTDIIIGTHALISEGVIFNKLGLVITDEQHRFGVAQRAKLQSKGNTPNMLVMSATPIPRTLALILYGDLDISIINEMPPGRKLVKTYKIDTSKRNRAFNFIKKLIDDGGQGYIVCPLVEENEKNNMIAVESYAKKISQKYFSNYKVGILHGKMKEKDKNKIIQKFISREITILVSTTVIEVGIDVSNANFIIVENTERFGLSQLHQLRGRVGRGNADSYCILISDAQNEKAINRLKVMTEINNGFKIADEDLKLRGPGDFFGERQHGIPELKIANLLTDSDVLKEVVDVSKNILQDDKDLIKEKNRTLKAEINRLYLKCNL